MELREFLKQPMTVLDLAKTTYERIGYNENLVTIGDFLTYYEEVKSMLSRHSLTLQAYDINTINRALAPYGIIFGMSELEIKIRSEFPNSILLRQLSEFKYPELYLTQQELLHKAGVTKILDLVKFSPPKGSGLHKPYEAGVFLKKHGLTFDMSDEQIELYCIAELIDQKMDAVLKQCTNLDTSVILSKEKTQQSFMALIRAMQWLLVLQNFKKKLQNLNNKPSDITNELARLLRIHRHG